MVRISRRDLLASFRVLPTIWFGDTNWIPLFDGHTLDSWKASGHTGSFRVVDGQIAQPQQERWCSSSFPSRAGSFGLPRPAPLQLGSAPAHPGTARLDTLSRKLVESQAA